MIARLIATTVILAFAVGAFCGAGPTQAGPINPFGMFFVGLAVLIWFAWKPLSGGLGSRTGIWDAFGQNMLGPERRRPNSDN